MGLFDLVQRYLKEEPDSDSYSDIEEAPLDDLGADPVSSEGDNRLLTDQPTPVRPNDIGDNE